MTAAAASGGGNATYSEAIGSEKALICLDRAEGCLTCTEEHMCNALVHTLNHTTTAGDSSRSEELGKPHVATLLSRAPFDSMLSHDSATSSSQSASNGFANGMNTSTRAPPSLHTLYSTANGRSPSPAAVARPHCPSFAMGGVVSPIKGLLVPRLHPTTSPTIPQPGQPAGDASQAAPSFPGGILSTWILDQLPNNHP